MAVIDNWLKSYKDKPKKQRHTVHRIYNRLVDEHGYKGEESTVRRYVRLASVVLGIETPRVFIPCNPEAGQEAEVDWGTATAIIPRIESWGRCSPWWQERFALYVALVLLLVIEIVLLYVFACRLCPRRAWEGGLRGALKRRHYRSKVPSGI
jgi:hypothetical protein